MHSRKLSSVTIIPFEDAQEQLTISGLLPPLDILCISLYPSYFPITPTKSTT